MPGKDAEIRLVADRLDELLDELRSTVDELGVILGEPTPPEADERLVAPQ